ncbi:AtzE family amidohydrolase [Roseomonas sp. F4]
MSARTLAAAIRARQLPAAEAVDAALARIAAANPRLNAFTAITAERARAEAAAVDAALAAGQDPGPLAGVPIAVKNLFDVTGLPTLAGSRIRREAAPAAADAFALARLRAAGAVLVGTTNMDEFAFGFTTENSHDGAVHNPHDLSRVAGGSSGGSAAAVAAGLVPIALGTDTNGSIRVPAALCGIWGLKPTYGRLSRRGAFPFVTSLDHVGPLAGSLDDLALAYDVMQGRDAADPVQQDRLAEPVSGLLGTGVEGLRIAIAGGHFAQGGQPDCFAALDRAAAALGASARIDLPLAAEGRAAALLITLAEGGSLHLPDLRSRAEDYDPLTRDRFLGGALLPAAWLIQAQRVRAAWQRAALAIFQDWDLLLTPTTPFAAQPIGTAMIEIEGRMVPARPQLGWFTQPISAIGLPALSVPMIGPDGLPLGVQLVAPPWREDLLFRAAAALQTAGIAGCPSPKDPF